MSDPLAGFKPYVPDDSTMRELSFKSILFGTLFGLLFGAVTVYLGLRAGLTVTVNIPIAIIAMAVFRALYKMKIAEKATILEINTAQTVGAACESIAAGSIFTLPALFFLGYKLSMLHAFAVALAGGLLGVCYLVPLRAYLIEKEHGILPYPEGVACAEVIKSGETGGASAAMVFWGAGLGAVYKLLGSAVRLWREKPFWTPDFYKGSTLVAETSPEMLGVGYIIGVRTSCIMVAGGLLSWMVLIPMIYFFKHVVPGTEPDLAQYGGMYGYAKVLWNQYIRYIGAGAVAAGGLINLARAMPTIIGSFKASVGDLRSSGRAGETREVPRTRQDMSLKIVLAGMILAIIVTWVVLSIVIMPGAYLSNFVAAIMVAVFGFFFATVSARLVGEIGVSSNPTSGMTIATLMATCLIFLAIGWTGGAYAAIALSIGAVVCICASNAGNVGQSLKTGFFLGCTPRKQEFAYTIGAMTSILAVGFTLIAVHQWTYRAEEIQPLAAPVEARVVDEYKYHGAEYDVIQVRETTDDLAAGNYLVDPVTGQVTHALDGGIGSEYLPAPQARLMATVIDGMLKQQLPWELIFIGIMITVVLELGKVKGLPFAVGVYLPLYTSAPIFLGGMIRWLVERKMKKKKVLDKAQAIAEEESGPAMLASAGLIAGGALAGLGIAALTGFELDETVAVGSRILGPLATSHLFAVAVFAVLCFWLFRVGTKKEKDA
ncbi:MAG: oligopeptide transporter, OPT family [Candidatus Eisenbacteria sp.]|nr:oligopeptide transporter, OPT family [Candidatus Eisenbacteria bacterium]